LIAFAWHEAGHAYVADWLGDKTPRAAGRVTLNPMVHLDLMGSVIFPLLTLFGTASLPGGPFVLGYAKPTPIRPGNLRKPKRDAILVSAAGAASNLLQALTWTVVMLLLDAGDVNETFLVGMAHAGIAVNLVLAIFNLFPMPPLDGGHILVDLLPWKAGQALSRAEPYGFFIVLALVVTGVFNWLWMGPLLNVGYAFLNLATSPLAAVLR
jgi:Zn-dependent protease